MAIRNPWGRLYLTPAIIQHLLQVHFNQEKIKIEIVKIDETILPQSLQSRESINEVRSALNHLARILTDLADPSLPLRKVRGIGQSLYYGGEIGANLIPKTTGQKLVEAKKGCFLLKNEANIAPSLTLAIPVMLDVTHKKYLDSEMFTYLKTAYLINLKKSLTAKGISCMLKDLKLYVQFDKFIFCLDVDPPLLEVDENGEKRADHAALNTQSMHNYIQSLSLRYNAWNGAFHVIKKWVSKKMMESVIPDLVIEFLLAYVFENPVMDLTAPVSCEAAVFRFFDLISFHDFQRKALCLPDVEDTIKVNVNRLFETQRSTLPAMVIMTPFDKSPSCITKDFLSLNVKRLINLARHSLHAMTLEEKLTLNWKAFEVSMNCDTEIFDLLIHLKPLQIPQIKTGKNPDKTSSKLPAFPVVDFDPVSSYLKELRLCFKNVGQFYYGRSQPVIGVKLSREAVDQKAVESMKHAKGCLVRNGKLVPNVDAMIEDVKILGSGIVKEVICSIKVERV